MLTRLHRRRFLKTAATATIATLGVPYVLAEPPSSKLNIAVIGCANQGYISVNEIARLEERLVALCDVDETHLDKTRKQLSTVYPDLPVKAIQTFFDYRKMFDAIAKQIDAVFVCTPDHTHAVIAMHAMKLGKPVYVEKPMAHSIAECRALAAAAKKYGVVTQLGNQGHSKEGIRRLCEYLWAGAIGAVTETHSWAPTGRGGIGGRPPALPVPATLHWDEWIGPMPFREYHEELHPQLWRSWWQFGDGSVGDWGCHNLDGAFMALRLGQPTSVEALEQFGGSDERFPLLNVIRWNFPARPAEKGDSPHLPERPGGGFAQMGTVPFFRGELPPVRVHWYDGYRGAKTANPRKELGEEGAKAAQNRPAIVLEIEKKYGRKLGDGGTIYVGEKGIMYTGNYCDSPRIIPEEKHQAFPMPEKKLPRVKGTHQGDFLRACRGGAAANSNFDYSGPLSEMVLLGCLAVRAGVGKKVEWDGANMQCANLPELNALVRREYRKGWSL